MSNNCAWFESPLPKPQNYNLQFIKPESQYQQEEHNFDKLDLYSPQQHNYKYNNNPKELSPWSKFIDSSQYAKEQAHALSNLLEHQDYKHQAIELKLIFSEEEESQLATPPKEHKQLGSENQKGQVHTAARKSSAEHVQNFKRSRPREKGLRKLSQRAYEIVQELTDATYKEVAIKLVQQMNEDFFEGESKEEQNIKRRVYDALNVLIALGVLRKDGRRIVNNRCSRKGKQKQVTEEIDSLKKRLILKNQILQCKLNKLKEAQQKMKSISILLKRNKNNNYSQQKTITFPFIGVMNLEQITDDDCQLSSQQFQFRSKHPLKPFGDMDCLKWLRQSLQDEQKIYQAS